MGAPAGENNFTKYYVDEYGVIDSNNTKDNEVTNPKHNPQT